MYHRIFNGSTILQLLVVFITAILLWTPAFAHSVPMQLNDMVSPFYSSIYNLFKDSPLLYTFIAFILLLGESFLLNNLIENYGLSPKNSYQTAFWYIILMSSFRDQLTLHPQLFVNLLIILVLLMIFRTATKEECYKEIFLAGFLIALSSLFFFKSVGIFVAFWIFLVVLQIYTWREWVILLIGFCSVYLYLFTYYLYFDNVFVAISTYRHFFQTLSLLPNFQQISLLPLFTKITIALISFLSAISIIKILFIINEKIVYIRKNTLILIWLSVISLITTLFLNSEQLSNFYFLSFPLSILISYYYSSVKKLIFSEFLFILLIVSLVFQRFL
ncbi:MAG: DUF6427 family protein [Bacteroidota bacterium]